MSTSRQWCTFALVIGVSFILMSLSEAAPMQSHINNNGYYNDLLEEQQQLQQQQQQQQLQPEEALLELIARFGQQILRARDDIENSKRTVDFGLARGFSGLQEAKHRMGLAAANFAGGPGRKRRSESQA